MSPRQVVFRIHAVQRMFERRISDKDVLRLLHTGETIEDHADDTPYPNRLMLGWHGKHPLHVVAVDNANEDETIVITVYKPDPDQWKSDFKRRKR